MRFKVRKFSLFTATGFVLLLNTVCSAPASALEEFNWNQSEAPKPMLTSNEGVCFLTAVQGKFQGTGEQVRVYLENNQWFIHGNSAQSGVGGTANCVRWNEIPTNSVRAITGPYDWSRGQPKTRMGAYYQSFCFLSAVSGRFEGDKEYVEITRENDEWKLSGGSDQKGGLTASAYCVGTPYNDFYLTNQFTLNQSPNPAPNPSTITFDIGTNFAACFLTRIQGKFQGEKERVSVSNNLGLWSLKVSSNQFGVSVSSRCSKK